MARNTQRQPVWLGLALGLALAGTLLHDLAEFGRPSLENSLPVTLVFGVTFISWWRWVYARRVLEALLLGFALVMLLGGAMASALPLPLWPFEPEQSLSHYAAHAAWAASLVPLVWVLFRRVNTRNDYRNVEAEVLGETRPLWRLRRKDITQSRKLTRRSQ